MKWHYIKKEGLPKSDWCEILMKYDGDVEFGTWIAANYHRYEEHPEGFSLANGFCLRIEDVEAYIPLDEIIDELEQQEVEK